MQVPGRKNIVSTAIPFMAELSRFDDLEMSLEIRASCMAIRL
jgi:hypothetical protein